MLEAYGKLHRYCELMWQHHSEFLLLGYGAYATFVDFCKNALPDIPDSAHRTDGRGDRRAPLQAGCRAQAARPARDRHRDRFGVRPGRSQQEIDDELAQSDAGKAWLEELEKVKDPWFNMATGDGLYHYYGSWLDDPSIPYASLIGYVSALTNGEEIERPTEELAREEDRLAEVTLLDEETRKGDELLGLSRMVFPYVEEHKFLCDYWFLTRWWNKVREFGRYSPSTRVPGGLGRHLPALPHRGPVGARRARPGVGDGRRAARPEALAADRRASKDILERLADWTPHRPSGPCPKRSTTRC